MELNKKYKVKNKEGIMTIMPIEIIKQDIGSVNYSLGDFKKLRVEFYEDDYISLYSHLDNKDSIIYFIEMPNLIGVTPTTYKCKIVESEVKEYDFYRIEYE